jgi:hypothetical protein
MKEERIEFAVANRVEPVAIDYDIVKALQQRVAARTKAIRLRMESLQNEKNQKEQN